MQTLNTDFFETFPIIKTDRLTLRDLRPTDAQEIFEMRSNGRVNQFIPRPSMPSFKEAEELIEKTLNAYQNKQVVAWAGILRENQRIIGTCGFNTIDYYNLRAEIGGEMSVEYWGKHIALEAVNAIVAYGIEKINLHSIEAKISPDNRGGIYLLEQLGFEKEAHFKDRIFYQNKFSDMAIYTLHASNYKGF